MGILKIKQTTQDGRSKVWKLDSSQSLHTFGLSRKAQIISIDSTHLSYQAALEYRENAWHFIEFDARVESPDTLIADNTFINLKSSKLEFTVVEIQPFVQNSLMNFDGRGTRSSNPAKLKILLVSNGGRLIRTEVQPINHQFTYLINGDHKKINFSSSDEWQTQAYENYTFKSKTILTSDLKELQKYTSNEELGKENKYLVFAVLAFFALITGIGVLTPKQLVVAEIERPASNVVVKINAKKMEQIRKKQGASAPKIAVSAPSASTQPNNTDTPPPAGNKVSAMIKGAVGARISQFFIAGVFL